MLRSLGLSIALACAVPAVAGAQTIQDLRMYVQNEEYARLNSACDGLIAQQAKKPEPYFYKGLGFYRQALAEDVTPANKTNLLNTARGLFQAGYDKNKNYANNLIGLGLIDLQQGNLEAAKGKFKQAEELAAADPLAYIEMAEGFIDYANLPGTNAKNKNEATDAAINYLTRAEAKDKNNADVYVSLGRCYAAKGVAELAETNYKKALNLKPANAAAHYELGRLLEKQKKYNEAVAAMKKAIEADAKFAPAYKRVVEIAFRAGQYEYAKQMAAKYRDLAGNDKAARVRYGQLLYLTNSFADVVREYTALLKDTTSSDIIRLLGYSQIETKDYAGGKQSLDKLFAQISEGERITKDYKYYGIAQAMSGQVDEAERNLANALNKDPEVITVYKDLYEKFKEQKDYAKAARFCEKYIQTKTDSPNEQYFLGWIYTYQLKEYQKALDLLTRLGDKYPEFTEAHHMAATAASALDPDSKQGLAKVPYERTLTSYMKLPADKQDDKKKKKAGEAAVYLSAYHYTIQIDEPKALAYALKAQELTPEDVNTKKIADGLKGKKVQPAELTF
jgi:tetratricopeptide (TPR) repeat protein